jgi:serine/threonine protein kinase
LPFSWQSHCLRHARRSSESTVSAAPAIRETLLQGGQLSRVNLVGCTRRTLSRGGWGNPDVLLVEVAGHELVVKDFAARAGWLRASFARWITAREVRAYQRLAGLPLVPRFIGSLDPLAFVVEYRPGRILTRSLADSLPRGFVSELEAGIEAMHARGVAHLDLRHRSNILAGEDGHPVLLDFASAVCLRPDGRISGGLLRLLARFDLRALEKWRLRLGD